MSHSGANVLVVDDDDAMVAALADVLRDQGYGVAVARNGVEALAYLETQPLPRLILLDLMMPVMDGYAFRAEQRKRADWAAVPTVVLSAGTIDPSIRDLELSGWLGKPTPLDTLLAIVEKHVRGADPEHVVQFYTDSDDLGRRVATFVASGLSAGEPVVVVATADHRALLLQGLEAAAIDVPARQRAQQLTVLDAEETLATLIRHGSIDASAFERVVGELVRKLSSVHGVGRLRAYGEMVDLLWQRGDRRLALSLERRWNSVIQRHPFSLYCSYRVDRTQDAAAAGFAEIVRQHSAVVPAVA